MTLREFWSALHAVLLYDHHLPTVFPDTIKAKTASINEQINAFLNRGQ